MVRPAPRWPNVEKQLVAWLKDGGRNVYTETPGDLHERLPAHRITRVGGADKGDGITKIYQLEVETFARSRGALWDAVAEIETEMYRLASNGTDEWYVDDVTETFAAAIVDYEDDGVRKASATYGIAVRPVIITTT